MTTQTSRLEGLTAALGVKAPVVCATTENVTLSGLQTIDGITLAEDDRVLVKDQSDASQNGIYLATTGSWTRTRDWNGARDATRGTRVPVAQGATNGEKLFFVTSANPITIGISGVTFDSDDTAAFDAISPITTEGDIIYGDASGNSTRLPGNTTTQKKALVQVGDGADSAAPAWEQISYNDLADTPSSLTDISGESIGDLSDVTITGASDGDVLVYDSVSGGFAAESLAGGASNEFNDSVFRIRDTDDATRKIAFDVQDVASGSTRTFRVPNQNDTLVGAQSTQTLSNKTLTTTTTINGFSGSSGQTFSLPATTTQLVGTSDTATLSNKTLSSPIILNGTAILDGATVSGAAVLNEDSVLNDLSDVVITGVTDGEALVYDSVSGNWVNDTVAGSSGETNTASNSGGGAGVFNTKTGVDLEFNDIVAGSNITVAGGNGAGDITITGGAGGAGETNTASNVGAGEGIFKQKDGVDLEFRSLTAGSNITISGGVDDLTITGGAGGSGDLWSDAVDSDIVPTGADSTYDLGTTTDRFAQSFVDDRRGTELYLTQASATEFVDGVAIPNDFTLDNPVATFSSYDTSNDSGTVHYTLAAHCDKASGSTDAAAINGHAITTGSNVDIWAATLNCSIGEVGGSTGTQTGNTAHGLEIAVRDFGASGNSGFGLVLVGMGNNTLNAAIQIQSNLGGSGTAANFQYGINFNNSPKDVITDSLIYDAGGSPNYGVNFSSTSFGVSAINIENCTGTYGVRQTGSMTIGFEHGGSGATAGFRAIGSGTSAFQVASSSYTRGLDLGSANFAGGHLIYHDSKFRIQNTGTPQFANVLFSSASRSFTGTYFKVSDISGNDYYLPCHL